MEDLSQPIVRVPSAEDMEDETFIKHLELRHGEALALRFTEEPDRKRKGIGRRLRNPETWSRYHTYLHNLYDGRENGPYRHTHKEPQ